MPRQASKGSKVAFAEVELKVILPGLERFQKYLKVDPDYSRLMSPQASSGESLKLPDEMIQNAVRDYLNNYRYHGFPEADIQDGKGQEEASSHSSPQHQSQTRPKSATPA